MSTHDDTITDDKTTEDKTTDDNKALVLNCLKLYGAGDLDAVAPLMRDDYADHGLPFQTSTRAGWIAEARKLPLTELRIDIRRIVAEGDLVTMFSRRSLPGGALDIAVADVFRVQEGLIAERWEVVEQIAADAPDPVPTL